MIRGVTEVVRRFLHKRCISFAPHPRIGCKYTEH